MADTLGGAREYRCCVRVTFKLVHVLRSLVSFLFFSKHINYISYLFKSRVESSYEGHSVAHWYKKIKINQNLGMYNKVFSLFSRNR